MDRDKTDASGAEEGDNMNGADNLEEILNKLDISEIPNPDRQIGEEDGEEDTSEPSGPLSRSSSVAELEREREETGGGHSGAEVAAKEPDDTERAERNGDATPAINYGSNGDTTTSGKKDSTKDGSKSARKSISPLKLLKRLASKDKKDKRKLSEHDQILMKVKVDALPQTFILKYMGLKEVFQLWGIQHTRGPLEELVNEIQQKTKKNEWEDLPLLVMRVSKMGLQLKEHKANKSQDKPPLGLIPIEFVSYGVQDIKYTRVFSFILVKEISSRAKRLECHSYVCDSTITARKLALSVSLAFKEYASSLKGKPYKFQVDLRSTKELEEDLNTNTNTNPDDECEA